MQELGKTLLLAGCVLVVLGLWLWKGGSLGGLGQLPGDIYIKRGNTGFYFPLMTCVLLSVLLSGVMIVLRWIFRR